jgi:hypothetical protein
LKWIFLAADDMEELGVAAVWEALLETFADSKNHTMSFDEAYALYPVFETVRGPGGGAIAVFKDEHNSDAPHRAKEARPVWWRQLCSDLAVTELSWS